MSISIGIGRVEERSQEKKVEEKWRLLKTIKLDANNNKILVNKDMDGNDFSCEEIIITGKVVCNTTSKPMCKINNTVEFTGTSSTFINGTRYIYDAYKIRGFFIERDMKYLNQNIFESSIPFDNGFFRVVEKDVEYINSIEVYRDSTSFTFKDGTELNIYGR